MPAPCAVAGREARATEAAYKGRRRTRQPGSPWLLARLEQAAGLRNPLKQAIRPATEAAHERRRRTRQPFAEVARL